jgi:hypothetical protein
MTEALDDAIEDLREKDPELAHRLAAIRDAVEGD